jgi:hypothetical protein
LLPDLVCTTAIQALGEYLEDEIGRSDYDNAAAAFDLVRRQRFPKHTTPDDGAWNALYCSVHRKWREEFDDTFAERRWELADTVSLDAMHSVGQIEKLAQLATLRDIFGNPFRPAAFDPAWRTSDVLLLARGIYEDRAFERMPILADALQDAGCDSADILSHCSDATAAHVRGCWVVDRVLGKE